jgi:hypothetical protein
MYFGVPTQESPTAAKSSLHSHSKAPAVLLHNALVTHLSAVLLHNALVSHLNPTAIEGRDPSAFQSRPSMLVPFSMRVRQR